MLDRQGQPLQGLPEIGLCLRAATATAGDAKPVHMVVDFGNSRTGALLIEMAGEVSQTAEMLPLELANRYALDHFNDEGEHISRPNARWFSSKTRWANTPYPEPPEMGEEGILPGDGQRHFREETGVPRTRNDDPADAV